MPVISCFPAGRNVKINGVSSLELKATGGLEGNQIGSTYTIDGSNKQDKLSGTKGQLVGFDELGNAIAQEAPNGLPDGGSPGQILTKTAEGETWQDAPDTGVKTFNGRSDDVMPQSGDYTAEMVGARPSTWVPTAAEVGALPVQYAPKKFTISLEASGWQSNQKTITVEGITTGNIVLLSPASKADADTWTAAGVWCTGQGANSLTFSCESVPSSAIGLNLMILEAAT